MNSAGFSRRAFVGAAMASPLARGASDRISLGIIGTGSRGRYHIGNLNRLKDLNFAINGICDVFEPARQTAAANIKKLFGTSPRLTSDYREMLAWKDIDAVIISSPDYTHSVMLKHAVEAGKDVYCEKPMGTVFSEAKAAYEAVKKSKQVVQIGTQRRSEGPYVAAAKLVHSGILGEITHIDVAMNFQEPRWRRPFDDIKPSNVDWKRFLMHRPPREFEPRLLREWQLFSYNTNGIAGLWMSHFSDVVHWFMQELYPDSAVSNGGVFFWKDGRETSDVFQTLLTYPKGFLFSFEMSLTNSAGTRELWRGTRGTLDMQTMTITGDGSKRPDKVAEPIKIVPEKISSHMHNFLECIRGRTTPRAGIQAGFSHAVAGTMASTALAEGKKVRFDRNLLEMIY